MMHWISRTRAKVELEAYAHIRLRYGSLTDSPGSVTRRLRDSCHEFLGDHSSCSIGGQTRDVQKTQEIDDLLVRSKEEDGKDESEGAGVLEM